jgi:hypothetical protein
MLTIENLINETKEFFNHYWNIPNEMPPVWSEPWDFNGTIPNHDKRGCYALFKDQEIIYIGVGIRKGDGIYQGCGLGYRLKKYWEINKAMDGNKKYQHRANCDYLTSLRTIGFDENHYALAAALEIYLINKLKPVKNFNHK